MPVLISLLRGVNVGGHHKIKMEELRSVYGELGFTDVRSYVQSGNVLFKSRAAGSAKLAGRIEDAIEQKWGFRPAVILRTLAEMAAVVETNPFDGRDDVAPNHLAVIFLGAAPAAKAVQSITAMSWAPEEVRLAGRELFIHFPNGMGQSKLAPNSLEKILNTAGTARNWNTVTKLLAMAKEMSGED